MTRPQKITFGELREMGVRGVLIYCTDYRCSYSIAVMADDWPDDVRLSDVEPRLVCTACGKRGATALQEQTGARGVGPLLPVKPQLPHRK